MTDYRDRDIELALEELFGAAKPPDVLASVRARLKAEGLADDNARAQTDRTERNAPTLRIVGSKGATSSSNAPDAAKAERHRRAGIWVAAACIVAGFGLMFVPEDGRVADDASHTARGDASNAERHAASAGQPQPEPIEPETPPILLLEPQTVRSRAELDALPREAASVICVGLKDADLTGLLRLRWIESLDLRLCPDITDATMATVGKLKTLKKLDLYRCANITSQGARRLTGLARLHTLDMSYTAVGDEGLVALTRNLLLLETLDFCGCDVSDAALAAVAGLAHLTTLNCWHCTRITGAGLRKLGALTKLGSLGVRGCSGLVEEDFSWLATALPACAIVR